MSMNFFQQLLDDGKLTQLEFERVAKFVDEKYDFENLDIKLAILRREDSESQLFESSSSVA